MKYFRLFDDVHVPARWHLGEVLDATGSALNLLDGTLLPSDVGAQVEVHHTGIELNFCLTSFAVPVARTELARVIEQVANGDVQRLSLDIPTHEGFDVLNSTRIIECLDEARSEFTKWTDKDHRADLAGQYRMVTKLKIHTAQVPPACHFFRIKGWPIALIVSENVKTAMERSDCLGAKFEDVT